MPATFQSRRSDFPGIFLLALVLSTNGCSLFHSDSSSSRVDVRSLEPTSKEAAKPVEVDVLANQVMRFADTYVATISQAVDDFTALPSTSLEARATAVRWKLSQGTIAYVNATGPNPVLNLLDMVVLASISRRSWRMSLTGSWAKAPDRCWKHTDGWKRTCGGPSAGCSSRNCKTICGRRFKSGMRTIRTNAMSPPSRLQELAAAVGVTQKATAQGPNNVFRMLYLDPFAGMDPTARAIQETRRLAERAMYYTQRMPLLLNWQVELLTLELAGQPETKKVLADMDRLTRSFESFAKVADQLPQLVNDQRQAAIQQVFEGMSAEEKKFRELLMETRQTLQAGSEMAIAVNTSVRSLDAFVKSVTPQSATNAVPNCRWGHPPAVRCTGLWSGRHPDWCRGAAAQHADRNAEPDHPPNQQSHPAHGLAEQGIGGLHFPPRTLVDCVDAEWGRC